MNNSFPRLIDGMCATLRSEVLSRLDDEFARGQVFGIINLLNTFKSRADWSTHFLSLQLAEQYSALNAVGRLLHGISNAPHIDERQAPVPISPANLMSLRDSANREIGQLLNWLDIARPQMESTTAQAVEDQLRLSMRREIEIELKNSPRPLFSEMSSGKE
jgi:hypothetical protein